MHHEESRQKHRNERGRRTKRRASLYTDHDGRRLAVPAKKAVCYVGMRGKQCPGRLLGQDVARKARCRAV